MFNCPQCGATLADGSHSCPYCGTAFQTAPNNQQQVYQQQGYQQQGYQQPNYPNYGIPRFVPPVSTGGLVAWAIITLLLCRIPGIVALVYTNKINKSYSFEEQQKNLSTARTWCLVGTILGVLYLIFYFVYLGLSVYSAL